MSLNVEHLRRTADTLPAYLQDVRALADTLQELFDAQS